MSATVDNSMQEMRQKHIFCLQSILIFLKYNFYPFSKTFNCYKGQTISNICLNFKVFYNQTHPSCSSLLSPPHTPSLQPSYSPNCPLHSYPSLYCGPLLTVLPPTVPSLLLSCWSQFHSSNPAHPPGTLWLFHSTLFTLFISTASIMASHNLALESLWLCFFFPLPLNLSF